MPYGQANLYHFMSGMKNIKKLRLTTHEMCGGDLIDAIKLLVENDTIEMLELELYVRRSRPANCFFPKMVKLRILNLWGG